MPRLGEGADQLLGDAAGHRRHRRDEAAAARHAAGRPRPCAARPGRAGAAAAPAGDDRSSAQQRQLGDQLVEHAAKAQPGALDALGGGAALAVGEDDAVDRPVLEVPAAVAELRPDARRSPRASAQSRRAARDCPPRLRPRASAPAAITSLEPLHPVHVAAERAVVVEAHRELDRRDDRRRRHRAEARSPASSRRRPSP